MMYFFFVPRLLICDPNSNDSDGRHIAGPYPNVPSMGTTEWWVHCFGSHFASPKSEICFIKNMFISLYEITSHWFNHTQYLWSTVEFKSFFCIADSTRLTVPFLWFEKDHCSLGNMGLPEVQNHHQEVHWLPLCRGGWSDACRTCADTASPSQRLPQSSASKTTQGPSHSSLKKNVIFCCHIVTDKIISSIVTITLPAKTDTVQCRCERPVCAELED
jgi:hypothetical protein